MADISLDEFIRKGNIKVRVSNTQQGKGKGKPQKNVPAPNRNGGIRPPVKNIDARQRLGPKPVIDARDKIIINKKSGVGDARNKIVQKQVQKGTFDARSLLQRQARKIQGKVNRPGNFKQAGVVGALPLRRTLSNPAAQGKAQVRVTDSGLFVTRPVQKTLVSLSAGGSIQVTSKSRPMEGNFASAIPIIQIRNDKYRHPAQQMSQQSQPSQIYSNPPPARQSPFTDYRSSGYPHTTFSTQSSGYKDYDDPQFNEASIAKPEIPKINVTNVRPHDAGSVKPPVPYMKEYAQPRAPPGAATVSQGAKPTVSKTVLQPSMLVQAGVKRKPEQEMSGPLRLGRGGGPGIDLGTGVGASAMNKKMKVSAVDMDVVDVDSEAEVISPLQGFRVMVTNLYSGVTQDDIIELFGAVGPLKKAKLLKPGTAEVVYVSKEDAFSAVQKYHSRELDGQPMYVKMTTPVGAVVKKAVGDNDPDITGEALRLYRKAAGTGSLIEAPIEIPTIHRALFKAGPPGPNKSVKFTVKI
ncbi:unnamed protein product [Candidula unifasciata]|uniref:RRM domain-containing protein n=1 Tax=Candidula unifasciata TaxID=100452 RepID=A0A8S3ZUJ2_9EUPU|nr:unnamed protein product [Candidula unifasciata]